MNSTMSKILVLALAYGLWDIGLDSFSICKYRRC